MSTRAVSSVSTPRSNDERSLEAEMRVVRLKTQVAVVRTLTDQIELLASPRHEDGLREQFVEEMTRLGCELVEEAAELTRLPA